MPRTPKNPNVERVAHIPFDKDAVTPTRQITPRPSGVGDDSARSETDDVPEPASEQGQPPAREEYPGPRTAESGAHVEPGRVRPFKPRER